VYVRADTFFVDTYEQIKEINSFISHTNVEVKKEFIDYTSFRKRVDKRDAVVTFFRSLKHSKILIYDIWVLSSNIEDLMQMISCLLKNDNHIILAKSSTIIDSECDIMALLSIVDNLRQRLHVKELKVIGRPKGSRSASKFDIHLETILEKLRDNESVSKIARNLGLSRSSLKDYIFSRDLNVVVDNRYNMKNKKSVIYKKESIECPKVQMLDKWEVENE